MHYLLMGILAAGTVLSLVCMVVCVAGILLKDMPGLILKLCFATSIFSVCVATILKIILETQ